MAFYGKEMVASSKCRWTNWIDRDNPSATGDWENSIWPPHPIYGTRVGPGTDCEYSQYRVRIKGTTTEYSDVNSLPPNPWVIHDMPNGIYCKNAEQTWMRGCGPRNPYNGKCCPDMEVRYCCKPKPQPVQKKCYCCPPKISGGGGSGPVLEEPYEETEPLQSRFPWSSPCAGLIPSTIVDHTKI